MKNSPAFFVESLRQHAFPQTAGFGQTAEKTGNSKSSKSASFPLSTLTFHDISYVCFGCRSQALCLRFSAAETAVLSTQLCISLMIQPRKDSEAVMRIGLTYDLRDDYLAEGYSDTETAEFDRADTIDAIENTLQQLGYQTDRIGRATALINRLAKGDRWDLVFNISEGLHGLTREAQVPSILDVYQIPYTFSDPLVLSICQQKELAKMVVRQADVPTPDSLLVEELIDLEKINLTFPLFAKPVAEGTGKGVNPTSKVENFQQLKTICAQLLAEFSQPVLVEQFLPGREFTVGIIGTGEKAQVVGVLEIFLKKEAEAEVYSYNNKENSEELVEYQLHRSGSSSDLEVRRAEQVALAAWRALGCRDGGRIDLRSDEKGMPNFIEANPLAGLHPEHSDLPMIATLAGLTYKDLLRSFMDSAVKRTLQSKASQ